MRLPKCAPICAQLFDRLGRFDEEKVRPGGQVFLGTADGGLPTLDRERVGPGHDQRLVTGVERGLDASDHLGRRHYRLAGKVPAALRRNLVLELDAARSHSFEEPNSSLHVDGIAIPGVGIDDQRQIDALPDELDYLRDLARRDEPDVGPAQPGVGDGPSGYVGGLELRLLDQQRRQRVVAARRDDRLVGTKESSSDGRRGSWGEATCGGGRRVGRASTTRTDLLSGLCQLGNFPSFTA